jgi:hypothetical protein
MIRPFRITLVLGGLTIVAWVPAVEAGLFFHHHEGTPPPGHPRVIEHTQARAGDPLCLSPHARPTQTPAYVSYYVGGGAAHGGGPRRVEEGTWGRDYEGHWIPRHVWLGWYHGRKDQGGTGYYYTDGHPVPDVIGLTASKLRNH